MVKRKKDLFEKVGKSKINLKPILKKQKQAVVRISEPRELPSDYQNPYIRKEIEKEKRRMFFS